VPTGYTPIYRILKDGVDVTARFNDRTTQIKVELISDGEEGDRATIVVDDRDWRIARPFPGDFLDISLGYAEVGLARMGSFQVDDVTFSGPPRSIQLTCTGTGYKSLMKAPAIQEYDNKTVGQILGEMGSAAGLGVMAAGDIAGKTVPFKNQVVSNLHLMNEIGRIYGGVAKVADGNIILTKRDGTQTASGTSIPSLILLPEHFGKWRVRHTDRPEFGQTWASYWDKFEHVRKWVDGGGSGKGNDYPLGRMFNSEDEAKSAAKSKMSSLNRATVDAMFDLAKGDPWIRDAQPLVVAGMRDGINGSYVIEKATHSYVKSTGIDTVLECKRPGDEGVDFSDRAKDDLWSPLPGELLGEYLKKWKALGDNPPTI
jgi:phage protein D